MSSGLQSQRRTTGRPGRYQGDSSRRPVPVSESPTELWYPVPERPGRSGLSRFWLFFFVASILLLMALMALAGFGLAWWVQSDRLLPGLQLAGLDVGGQTTSEALGVLDSYWQGQSISLEVEGEAWVASPASLGMQLDSAATVERAYQQGRSLETLEKFIREGGHLNLLPVWTFEPATAEAYLQTLAAEVGRPASDAGVRIVDGRAEVVPPQTGRELDVAATMSQLTDNPALVLTEGRLPLVVVLLEPQVVDTSAVAEAANRLLATPLTLRLFDPISNELAERLVSPEVWSGWLSLEIGDASTGQFNWRVEQGRAQPFIDELANTLGSGRTLNEGEVTAALNGAIGDGTGSALVRIYHDERSHVVQPGETLSSIGRDYGIPYPWIQQANPESAGGLYPGQALAIPSPDALLPLPVVPGKRIVVSIAQQRVLVYENGALKWDWPASTGIDRSPTAPGVFQIQSHEPNAYATIWDLWMPSFMGVYRPVPTSDFMNGFHGFPTRSGSNLLWTGDLGHKVTYGCILLSSDNAAALYDWAEEGVIVEIRP